MSEGRERKLGRVKVAAESDSQKGRKRGGKRERGVRVSRTPLCPRRCRRGIDEDRKEGRDG
jgi:hypothetical protein